MQKQVQRAIYAHDEKKLIGLRRRVNEMYFNEGYSKNSIVRCTGMSKQFVITWTQSQEQDFSVDGRGWQAGKGRKWGPDVVTRVLRIHDELKASPDEYFYGAPAITQVWRERYADQAPPSRTIGAMLKASGRTQTKRGRSKGAAARLCYPSNTLREDLGRIMEADFIGPRFITGNQLPLHFIGVSCPVAPKLRWYQRVEAQTADALVRVCRDAFTRLERPDCLKVDNATSAIGSASGRRNLSRLMIFLLENQINPVFAVPRKPFSQASIEGNNSVFARKFWNRIVFQSADDVDARLVGFNQASLRYTDYQAPPPSSRPFRPSVFFLRQVRERDRGRERGYIDVLNEEVPLPKAMVHLFVLAEWNLDEELLTVSIEKDQSLKQLKQIPFPINTASKKKAMKGGLLSYCQ